MKSQAVADWEKDDNTGGGKTLDSAALGDDDVSRFMLITKF